MKRPHRIVKSGRNSFNIEVGPTYDHMGFMLFAKNHTMKTIKKYLVSPGYSAAKRLLKLGRVENQ